MPKYEFTWWEQRKTVIEAQDEEEAWEALNDGGEDDSEFLGSDNYHCTEVRDADI